MNADELDQLIRELDSNARENAALRARLEAAERASMTGVTPWPWGDGSAAGVPSLREKVERLEVERAVQREQNIALRAENDALTEANDSYELLVTAKMDEIGRLRARLEAADELIAADGAWLAGQDCQSSTGIKRALKRCAAARAAYDTAPA